MFIGGYLAGFASQFWQFLFVIQVVILMGIEIMALSIAVAIAKVLFKPSPQQVQNQMHELWKRGDTLLKADISFGPEWEAWAADIVAMYARYSNAKDMAWLHESVIQGHQTISGMNGIAELGRRLDSDRPHV